MGCVSQDNPQKNQFCGELENWDRIIPKFSKGTLRHAKTWERKGPSQGVMQKYELERIPWAPKFEDRTLQESLQQGRCARREAWNVAKHVCKLKNEDKATFSPTEAWVMLAPSSKKPDERICGRFQGIDAHAEQKGLSSGELETLRISRNPDNGSNCQWRSANK